MNATFSTQIPIAFDALGTPIAFIEDVTVEVTHDDALCDHPIYDVLGLCIHGGQLFTIDTALRRYIADWLTDHADTKQAWQKQSIDDDAQTALTEVVDD